MLTVGVKKVIVDDVTAVDEESEIKCKFDKEYLNLFTSKTRLKHWKRFSMYIVHCTGNDMCVALTCWCIGRHGCSHCDYVSQVCMG